MNFPRPLLTALLLLIGAAITTLQAQDVLTTLGTTVTVGGQTHAYLLWQPQNTASTLVRRIGVYSKPGTADGPGTFVRESIQTLQSSPRTIRAMLELGSKLDRDAKGAAVRIDAMYRDITLRQGSAPANPADPNLDAAEKLAFIIQSAVTDPKLLGRLFFLGRAHAGIMLALGHAFTRPMIGGARTYEVRELNDADADLRVLGRVTLDPAAPLVLAAPEAPVPVPNNRGQSTKPNKVTGLPFISQFPVSAKDHLNVRFRWATSDTLKQQLAHTFGFDLFRVKKATAETLGWHRNPPAAADLLNLMSAINPASLSPEIATANELPILSTQVLTPTQAAVGPGGLDRENIFFADDGVLHTVADGTRPRRPFVDGESFYYFVAARSIAGQPGLLSKGTLVMLCDRLPPNPPDIESVLSTWVSPTTKADYAKQGGTQFLRLKFRQLPDTDEEGARLYYIYRWRTAQEHLEHLDNASDHRIGIVKQHGADKFAFFDDNNLPESPKIETDLDKSVWYTVRAVGRTKCGDDQTLSGHSPPVFGVLRDFKAPPAPTGSFITSRNVPSVSFGGVLFLGTPNDTDAQKVLLDQKRPSPGFEGLTIEAVRNKPDVSAAFIELALRQADGSFLTVYGKQSLYKTANVLSVSLPYTVPTDAAKRMRIRVRAIAATGLVSTAELKELSNTPEAKFVVATFNLTTTLVKTVAQGNDIHNSANVDGSINAINGVLDYGDEPNIREWRVYRRVGTDGELSLIAKGEGEPKEKPVGDPNVKDALKAIPEANWKDDALPAAVGTRVCYYGQILDQNANASPLTQLGCVQMVSSFLPTPMLTQPKAVTLKNEHPALDLEWFCDPVGVERFEVLIAQEGGGEPTIEGLARVAFVNTDTEGDMTTVQLADAPGLSFPAFQTTRLSSAGIGTGPRFTVRIAVLQSEPQPLHIAVRAVGPGTFPRAAGSASNIVVTALLPTLPANTDPLGNVIPWPARPLPPVYDNGRPAGSYAPGEGEFLTVPFADFGAPTGILVGATQQVLKANADGSVAVLRQNATPKDQFFKIRTDQGDASLTQDLMPFMIYRFQLPSPAFPTARPNLVQCTPLIDRISFKDGTDIDSGATGHIIRDPYLVFVPKSQALLFTPSDGTSAAVKPISFLPDKRPIPYLDDFTAHVFVKDLLPVIEGAKYQHLIVRFDALGEVRQVIPAQPIQH